MALHNKVVRNIVMGAAFLAFALVVPGPAPAQDLATHVNGMTGNAAVGKQLFRRFCIGCHGPNGDGKGENAVYVQGPYGDPLPRDFVLGLFKCRSTVSGSLPQDVDLYNTITRGIYTTYMPTWRPLTPQQRVDLVAYIKTFSDRFRNEMPDKSIVVPAETADTPESVQRGQELYQKTLKCYECHGTAGHGDGPSASTLRDNLGNPIKPFDFTLGTRFKCGETNADLYRIFMTGLDGTPMPSWADYMNPGQAWDLVHYLRTLMVNYHPQKSRPTTAKQQAGK